jgi:hypothetical protein
MSKYEFAKIEISLCNKDEDYEIHVYQQTLFLDALMQNNPNWLNKVIAVVNDLEVKNV